MKNCYTDAPPLHSNLLVGSLQLLFWLFFHPSAWRNYVAHLDPTLSPDFTLADLNRGLRHNSTLQRLLIQGFAILPLLASLVVGLLLWALGVPVDRSIIVPFTFILAINVSLGLMIGSVLSVAAGMAGSVMIGLAYGTVASVVANDYLESILAPTAMSIAIGAVGSVAGIVADQRKSQPSNRKTPIPQKVNSSLWAQIGSIVIGVLIGVGVVTLVQLGLTTLGGLAVGLTENTAYWLSRTLVVGGSFGVAIGWHRGIMAGLVGSLITGLVYGLAVVGIQTEFFGQAGLLVDSGLAIGLASGLLFGTSFGVTVVLPYVLADQIAGAWAGAWAGALGSWGRHVFRNNAPLWPTLPLGLIGISLGLTLTWWRTLALYPFLAAWNLILYHFDKQRTAGPSLFRFHSAFWDEFQRLPLSGLDDHLLLVMDRNPAEGQAALEYLSTSRQRWAAQAVQIELEARRLEGHEDLTVLSHIYRSLAIGEWHGPASAFLRHFSHLSRDIEAALNQTTVYHQRLALNTIDDRLTGLIRELTVSSDSYATRFYPIAVHWQQLVANQTRELAEAAEQNQEIDNPYVVGVPLTEQQEIFVGRTDIVARIEQLLLDRRQPPLLLYGQRRMGKTSLLRNLGRLLPRTIVPLFVDGQRISLAGDYADFLYNLAKEMKKSAEKQRNLILPALSYEILTYNPFTCFNEWLDEVEQLLETDGYNTALLALDEFETLDTALTKERFDETDILSTLRHMIQHRPYFKVLLAGSHTLEELQRWASYLINVQVLKVGYLHTAEARQLIERPFKDFALRYQPEASQRVLELTRGHPALVQLLCSEIVTLKNEQDTDTRFLACPADVETAVARALNSGTFFFADIQHNQVDKAGLNLLRFLAANGEGAETSQYTLAERCPAEQVAELDQTLRLLLQRDLIERSGNGYRFQVELVRRWFEQ